MVPLFYYRRTLLGCVMAGFVVGGALAIMARTQFLADTLMLVLIGPESAAAQDASGAGTALVSVDGLKVVQSEIQIIQTDQVIRAAAQQIGPAILYPALAGPRLFGLIRARDERELLGAVLEKFRADLRVENDAGSNLIRISFPHPDRDVAIRTVQAVLGAYLAKRREIYASTNSSFLEQQIARYQKHLDQLKAEIESLGVRYDVLDIAQDILLVGNRLDSIMQRQNQVRERIAAVQTEVVAVRINLANQREIVLDYRERSTTTGNDEARNTLVRLQQQRTHFVSAYSASWAGLDEIDRKIEVVRAQISANNQRPYTAERMVRNPAINVLDNRLASLEVEEKALVHQLEELVDQSHQADQRAKTLREADGQLHALILAREVTESAYRQLSARQPGAVFQDKVVEERNANLHVVQPPTSPILGRSLAVAYLFAGVFVGLLLGVASSVIASMLRHIYITPTEVERDLALPSLGTFDQTGSEVDSLSQQNEIAALSALLQDITVGGRWLSSLLVVGATAPPGNAAVIRALGAELATAYDRRTLIVDLQGDGQSHALALGQPQGYPAPSLQSPIPVAATRVAGLWVAVRPTQSILGDHHAPRSQVRATLDKLRQQFGMLLIIGGEDGAEDHGLRRLAGLVDGNMLVLQAEQTRTEEAARLCSTILAAGGNTLGFLFMGRRYYVPGWLYRRL
jgi:hypothetical protein